MAPMIEVEVLFFARARELTGNPQLRLQLPQGATVSTAAHRLEEMFPGLGQYFKCCRLALNEEFASGDALIRDKSVLAVIPPVSGG